MQLVTARFQADQKRPATTCVWTQLAPDRGGRAVVGAATLQGLRVGPEVPSPRRAGSTRVHVRREVDRDRGWLVSHKRG
jgi:hypothetical protein